MSRRGLFLLIVGSGLLTAVAYALSREMGFAYRAPAARLVLEALATVVAGLGTFLLMGRLRERSTFSDALVAVALTLFAIANLTSLVASAIQGPTGSVAVSSLIAVRLAAVATLAVAPFSGLLNWGPMRRPARMMLLVATGIFATISVTWSLVGVALRPQLAADLPILTTRHPVVAGGQLASALLFAIAALGFHKLSREHGDELFSWMAPGSVCGAFSRINYFLFPSELTEYVYAGDVFRFAFYVLILIGVAREVQSYWGALALRNREVESYARFQREFVATASHELRTPLTSIIGYLELIADETTEPATKSEALEVVRRNANRLQELVDDLLTVQKMDTGELDIDYRTASVMDVVGPVVESFLPICRGKGVELKIDVPSDKKFPEVRVDVRRTQQILGNLFSNAVKFTPSGGVVTLSAVVAGDSAVIRLTDSGSGIEEGEHDLIFRRYYRSPSATKQAVPGTGLGLAIARAMAEAQGGSLVLEEGPGPGATFALRIPLEDRRI